MNDDGFKPGVAIGLAIGVLLAYWVIEVKVDHVRSDAAQHNAGHYTVNPTNGVVT